MTRTIGEIIKELRNQRKITQEELAELVGVTPQTISKWERDVGYPDITQIVPLSKAFGVCLYIYKHTPQCHFIENSYF